MKARGVACGLLIVMSVYIFNAAAFDAHQLNRSAFPPGFVFGTASAAYQYEGAAREDGRGPSIWDTFCKIPGKIADGSNGDVAVDEYHRYKGDVKLMKKIGMDAYRFSISWSRVLPKGTLEGGINQDGVAYYHHLIKRLLRKGITPFVTLFHWDLPQTLEVKYGGFLSSNVVSDFAAYADFCFKTFGGRVKYWTTLNEPLTYASVGYNSGVFAPGRCSAYIGNCSEGNSATEPYIVAHNLLLAHAAAIEVYKSKYQAQQKGSIGITVNSDWILPNSNDDKDREAAERSLDFGLGWFMNPLAWGDYPTTMRDLVGERLPKFTKQQSSQLKGSFDFIGLNHYTSQYATDDPNPPNPDQLSYSRDSRVILSPERNGVPIGPKAASSWLYVYPPGIKELLVHTKNRYNNPPIIITENGVDEYNNDTLSLKEALNDTMRVDYYANYLSYVRSAISEEVDLRGYFAWSLLDNFEWANGYTVRFGLYFVDYKNHLKRYPKASARWFRRLLSG